MSATPAPPITAGSKPYGWINDLQAAERSLLYDAFALNENRVDDPEAFGRSLWTRIDGLEANRRTWFELIAGPRPETPACDDGSS